MAPVDLRLADVPVTRHHSRETAIARSPETAGQRQLRHRWFLVAWTDFEADPV